MNPTTILFGALLLAVATAHPVHVKENIRHLILNDQDTHAFTGSGNLFHVQHNTLKATSENTAGIAHSRIGYVRISAYSYFTIPATKGVKVSAELKGSIRFKGLTSESVEKVVSTLAERSSSELFSFYEKESKKLKSRAKANFFWFFQAAAKFGFTNDKTTKETVEDSEFEELSEDTSTVLKSSSDKRVVASYGATYSVISPGGKSEVVRAGGFVKVNQVTLQSGEVLNIIKTSPELVVADDKGDVLEKVEDSVKVSPEGTINISDLLIDTSP